LASETVGPIKKLPVNGEGQKGVGQLVGENQAVFGEHFIEEEAKLVPIVGSDGGIGPHFPVKVAEKYGAAGNHGLAGNELVMRDGVGGKVREVAKGKGPAAIGAGVVVDGESGFPVVAELFYAAEAFGDDHIGGEVSEEIIAGVRGEEGRHSRCKQAQLAEQIAGQFDMSSCSPRPNFRRREKHGKAGQDKDCSEPRHVFLDPRERSFWARCLEPSIYIIPNGIWGYQTWPTVFDTQKIVDIPIGHGSNFEVSFFGLLLC